MDFHETLLSHLHYMYSYDVDWLADMKMVLDSLLLVIQATRYHLFTKQFTHSCIRHKIIIKNNK